MATLRRSECAPHLIFTELVLSFAVHIGSGSMRANIGTLIVVILSLAACSKPVAGQPDAPADNPFPQKGNYHVIHQVVQGIEGKTDEFDSEMGGFDRQTFESELAKDAGSNCRDKQVSIGNGSFNVHMTCSTPDGDFNNISVERQGSFSRDSIEVTTQTTLLGVSSQESFSAHLKPS